MNQSPADLLLDLITQRDCRRDDLFKMMLAEFPDMAEAQRISVMDAALTQLVRAGKVRRGLGLYYRECQ